MQSSKTYLSHYVLTILIFFINIDIANASQKHSPSLTGFLGLNNIPNARMDNIGTVRTGLSIANPYIHGFIGVQIAKPLYINIRQSALTSNISNTAKSTSSGIDIKLRLIKESTYRPEISLGIQSIIGNKRMAGEYLAISKKYKNFDFTTGIGWGRLGSSSRFKNPLKYINPYYGKTRETSLSKQNQPANWFSGETIGFFGGIEYFTPYDGLSLKLDYGSDKYTFERLDYNIKPPSPWAFGASYTHNKWLSASVGAQGTSKIFAQISLQSNPSKWSFTHKKYKNPKPFYKTRPQNTNITKIKHSSENEGIILNNISTKGQAVYADLKLNNNSPAPKQIGRATRLILMNISPNIEEINITPKSLNLHGTSIKIIRSDIEKSINNNASPQEIWKNIEFTNDNKNNKQEPYFLPKKGINNKPSFTIALENQISLSEQDIGALYRSSALINIQHSPLKGLITGLGIRLNIANNLDNISKTRSKSLSPIRSDIYNFTQKPISLENAYLGITHSFTPEIHSIALAGYLEEFYNGYGAEILYRPFSSRFAIGAEIWNIKRRDPYTLLNLGNFNNATTTGFINGWYDFKEQDLTLSTKIGRFLAGDTGISLGLDKSFKSGAKLSATTTLSNYKKLDSYGNETSSHYNISLTLPLGSIPHIPEGSKIVTKISPFGKDIGQALNPPLKLFETTEAFTLDHMANNWLEIMD